MKDIKAKILFNEKVAPAYFKMGFDAPGIAGGAKPGQFVQIRCSDGFDPLLRRPFSIHRLKGQGSTKNGIEILYEVLGRGTEILSNKKKDELISVLGPLGTGFTLPSSSILKSTAILIAGGIGVAPLVFLAEELTKLKIKSIVLIGAKTKNMVLCEKDFRKMGAEVHIATDDGTYGSKGFVSRLFKKFLRTTNDERLPAEAKRKSNSAKAGRTTIYACGPEAMLECIACICKERKLRCQVSVEERMACGIGVCLGCAIKVKDKIGYKLACKDGPVFNASEIVW